MTKILFVCHGNICRSPMAEFVMKDLAKNTKLELYIASAATSTEEIWNGIGNPVYPPAKKLLAKKAEEQGVSVAELVANAIRKFIERNNENGSR